MSTVEGDMSTARAEKKIAILDRGWIFVGDVTGNTETLKIENASCVRYWGTTNGIGQLALEGPLAATKLDKAGTVEVPIGSVIALIACDEKAWAAR